jgi:hypothetical protein
MRTRFRYDADLDAVVEIRGNYFEETKPGPSVISDGLNGIHGLLNHADRKTYDSKRAFEAATRAHGCETVGNEDMGKHVRPPELIGRREIGETIKRAFEEHRQFGSGAIQRAKEFG